MSLRQTDYDLRTQKPNAPIGGVHGRRPARTIYDPNKSHDDNILAIKKALMEGRLDKNSLDVTFLGDVEMEISTEMVIRK